MEILSINFWEGNLFSYVVLPLLIFFARISDVTVGTLRIVMVSKGQKLIAPLLGFFEVIIWLVTMSKIIQNIDNWVAYVAYGAGFATGNYIGLIIEEKLAVGIVQLQIITRKSADNLIAKLKASGYGITHHEAQGANEKVAVIYTIIKRNEIKKVLEIMRTYNPNAFYSIEDVKSISKGVPGFVKPELRWRKGK
ncbi:DUF2179 domain-containing protein [Sunxiuqinia elliptica]|uniref:UPF0316 protein DET52_10855 n=1 Tax=Sunxiuqinia elliptica TaxID=655355 RepID=A0A4V3BXG5_9BACT|nr:DUF2179 domain-containing protein [Sunxiuqinia elliptica]TDN98268.1 uncharacterized protein YebE (UPF0316 family) [Sunxiuqinia elliptica]TDO60374.1 uncharacterized protein YebE (UPF0316 family) [Sunxiuqinia elliptica]